MSNVIQRKTACTRDCPDACSLLVTIEDGKAIRLQGDPDHPITQGFLCHRTSRYLDRQYSPDRMTKPLFRKSTNEDFKEIGWDDALDLLAEKMETFRAESGAASIMQYRCGGSMGIMKHVGDYFFEKFGPATIKSGDVCAGAGEAAQLLDFGDFDSNDFFDFHNSKTIFLWGKNIYVSSVHLIPELKKARKNGAKIVLLDPVHHQTETIADVFVQPRPGSDAAIALGIARWIFENGKDDPNASGYCDHVDEFRAEAFSKTLEEWAALADIETETLIDLATDYSNGPTCNMIGWGLQRRKFGATTVRAIDALTAISGNLGIRGGGASFYFVRRGAFDFSFMDPNANPRTIPEPILADELLRLNDPPIRMMYVWSANPVAMLPDSERMAKALRSRDFTVVVDPFLTDSAKCAHLFLPTTTMLEEDDYVGAYGHHYLGEVHPVVEPPTGVLTDHQIFAGLSRRLGMADEFDVDASVWKAKLAQRIHDAGAKFENGYVKNPFVSDVIFEDRVFQTESGKANLIAKLPEKMWSDLQRENGIKLTSLSTRKAQASQYDADTQETEIEAKLHPSLAPNYSEGDVATIESSKGSMKVRLKFDAKQRKDVILIDKGGWHTQGRCANSLISGELTDDGECAVYYDTEITIS